MPSERNIILKPRKIRQKLERMAYEIYEDNYKEKEIIIAGINVRGYFVAEKLAGILKKITGVVPSLNFSERVSWSRRDSTIPLFLIKPLVLWRLVNLNDVKQFTLSFLILGVGITLVALFLG